MSMFKEEYVKSFLEQQEQLFDEPVAETLEEAEAFLEDCFAVLADTIQDVRDYLEDIGMDVDGMSDDELADAAEVFTMPDGKYLIVEG